MVRSASVALAGILVTLLSACGNEDTSPLATAVGGQGSSPASGGVANQPAAQGGSYAAGGASNPGSPANSGGTTGANSGSGGTQSANGGATAGGASNGGTTFGVGGNTTAGGSSANGGASNGGATNRGGASNGGATNRGGATSSGGSSTSGGAPSAGGNSNAGGAAAGGKASGGAASGGAASGGAASGGAASGGSTSTLAKFSFFVASDAALIRLSGNANGFGGDLRYNQATGLAGADKLCAEIAEASMPGASAKQWRAFLSIAANGSEQATNAIDRIGSGPWYDRLGRTVALTKAALQNERPQGADSAIIDDLPNETGTPNHNPAGTGNVDNHDTLTGSNTTGQLASTYANTCNNWTSSVGSTGKPVLGHSWIANSGRHWIQVGHTAGGCAPGRTVGTQGGQGTTVGAMGGYGGFYCFALQE